MKHGKAADPSKFLVKFAEQSSLAFFVYAIELGQVVYLNKAFEEVWGINKKNVEEHPSYLLETIYPDDKEYVRKTYQDIITDEKAGIEFRILLPGKSVKHLRLHALLDKQEPYMHIIIGYIEDITAQKNKDNAVKKQMAKKDSILQIIAHDLAGPLNSIKGLSTLIADKLRDNYDSDLGKMIEMITKTSQRSIRLIHEFVTQEFLESTAVELTKRRVNIVERIREITNQYQSSEEYLAKTFKFSSSDQKIFVEVDDFKFTQVIQNLISNALKFTYDGGVIALNIEEKEDYVLITVTDNGVGVPANRQNVLFEKLIKARRSGLKGEPSIGLGMSIIKTIVEWHNGKIWFESEENKGTTFYIEIPKE